MAENAHIMLGRDDGKPDPLLALRREEKDATDGLTRAESVLSELRRRRDKYAVDYDWLVSRRKDAVALVVRTSPAYQALVAEAEEAARRYLECNAVVVRLSKSGIATPAAWTGPGNNKHIRLLRRFETAPEQWQKSFATRVDLPESSAWDQALRALETDPAAPLPGEKARRR
ncbi:hypothetical protein [Acetobacter fallax]|uniref:Uncharacterized protein n=1 Tax=Acetobacter fallax TaxID=1737473 RepID=A0ABX0KF49_9PROT|nr:hypothetical protein [Acetobacter fallax]NHO33568.1 hypothetical protein [Acetobacter fallax]NHO37186.1 hypothetical protein [Acetobacter fallax]